MCGDSIRGLLGLVFSILLVCGIFYGCGSWYSYLDEKHSEARKSRESKLPMQYRGFQKDFSKDIWKFELDELKDQYAFNPTKILLKPNWKSEWLKWNDERCKHLKCQHEILSRYVYRLHSVSNPPESEFIFNSLLLDEYSWKLECEEKKLEMLKNLFSLYDRNSSKWTVRNGKITYLDESFRKNIEIVELKYHWMCDRVDKSLNDDYDDLKD